MTIIETERLILRDIDMDRDFEPFCELMSDEETVRWIGGETLDPPDVWRSMCTMIGAKQVRGYSFMSVEHKDTGEWLGRIGPWYPHGWPAPEIGWTLMRKHWGNGYAIEAARGCLDYVYNELGWDSVIHLIAKENIGSIKVAEKLGSTLQRDFVLPGFEDVEIGIWGQDKPARS